jgi:hypothetical protein
VDDAIERLLAQRWTRYEEYKRSGAAYSALVRLGEIINVLRHGGISEPVGRKWNVAARQVEVSNEMYRQAVAEAKQNISRVERMLGIGTTFLYEELMLALTVRVELGLLCEFFIDRGIALEFSPGSFDEKLLEVSRRKENVVAFRSAQAAAKRNWGVPVQSPWLDGQQSTKCVQS